MVAVDDLVNYSADVDEYHDDDDDGGDAGGCLELWLLWHARYVN